MIKIVKFVFFGFVLILLGCNKESNATVINSDTLFTTIPSSFSNLNFQNTVVQTKENNHMINSQFISGGGVAVGDINNDGLQDIFFTGNQVSDKLFLNKGNMEFEDISASAGITKDTNWSTGVTFVDIDNDGDQDIYVCRFTYLENEKSANQLYINNGNLKFTEEAASFGIADKGFSIQATFLDYDKDGLVDLYVVNQPPSIPNIGDKLNYKQFSDILFSDRLYKNMGNGKFEDKTDESKIRNFGFGLAATTGDFNNDGWEDIYVSNDFDVADHMYINQKNGTFSDKIHKSTKHISNFSMGSDVADYDNDGNLDIMVVDMMAEDHKRIKTNMGGMAPEQFWKIVDDGGHYQYMFNTLQRNNGNGTFSELAQLGGVTSTDWSWAPLFADFDNDGYKDLLVTNGVIKNNRYSDLTTLYDKKIDSINKVAMQRGVNPSTMINVTDFMEIAPTDKLPNYIYKNNGDYTFSNKVEDWGFEKPTLSNGAAYADFDLDGDLDLVINNINENALLYRNNTVEKEENNFLRIKLVSDKNKPLYGTKVSLYQKDTLKQVYQMTNARGFMSKSEDVIHFGVGTANNIDKLIVEWNDGANSIVKDLAINKLHLISNDNGNKADNEQNIADILFEDVASAVGLDNIKHDENLYDDYQNEVLLPHKMSQFGPSIGVGDVNGDEREDFFLGGAAGYSGKLFIQNSKGKFNEISEGAWTQDSASEDMGVVFLDVDGDKDLDLFIVSGGNEFKSGDKALQDRLYINNGKGGFMKSTNALPNYLSSGSCALPFDYDKDGDMDIFIGGRLSPQKYPHPANSYLLENINGRYVDVTKEKAAEMENLGMVTSASWSDYNNDGLQDIIVVGEWMPVTIFEQSKDGKFNKHSIEDSEGWYYSVSTADMDNDGDEDLVVGNLGQNYKYKASSEEPFEVHSLDFDNNGSLDIVLSYYDHGISFPLRGKSCSTQQIPSLKEKFPSYEEFGSSDLQGVYGESLKNAFRLQAKTFASAYIENQGNRNFEIKPLPSLAQVSSVNNILINDFDNDGFQDLLISGNLYQAEIETPRNDASTGLFLSGNGKGDFKPLSIKESGFYAPHDAKDMVEIIVDGKKVVLVANNNDFLQAIEHLKP